jgi:hypothetical protein
MHRLSTDARFILDRMELDRPYDVQDLRALAPDTSSESLRDIMHELWVNRLVERDGFLGWRRHRAAPARAADSGGPVAAVRPEELFDHAAFADFFK